MTRIDINKLVVDRSESWVDNFVMTAMTTIAASEAKAKFSELLERARKGEGFAITLHGQEVAKLVPAQGHDLNHVQAAIAELKSKRIVLNPAGKPRLQIKAMINKGRA